VIDPAQNRRILDAMPPFGGTNYMTRLKPAATLLAVSATPIPQGRHHAGLRLRIVRERSYVRIRAGHNG